VTYEHGMQGSPYHDGIVADPTSVPVELSKYVLSLLARTCPCRRNPQRAGDTVYSKPKTL